MSLRDALPAGVVAKARAARERLLRSSLTAAAREQGLAPWIAVHEKAIPALDGHYSDFKLDSDYLVQKVRAQQAFQISLAAPVLEARPGALVVDIGDSSGAHAAALRAALPSGGHRFLSVNLDAAAVERVKARGFEAVHCRAEELEGRGLKADVFLSFETLEHLSDPMTFLHRLSLTPCQRLVLTVPYVRTTRVGLHHLRNARRDKVSPETVHIVEFCPQDLKLLARHAGWAVETERIYRQYPLRSSLRATAPLWRRHDFEGFYGLVLKPDPAWSSLYTGWT